MGRNKKSRTINADADFGLGDPLFGHEPRHRTRGIDFWEKNEENEKSYILEYGPKPKARYRQIIGDAPRLKADDREGAREYLKKVELALNTFGNREDGIEGHWNRTEKNNLQRIQKLWKKRAEGEDEWFKKNGNYTEQKNIKKEKFSKEVIEGLKGRHKEKRIAQLTGKKKRMMWKVTGRHGVTGEPIYEWKEELAKGVKIRTGGMSDLSDMIRAGRKQEERARLIGEYEKGKEHEEKVAAMEEKIKDLSSVIAAIEIWRDTLREANGKLRRLSEKRVLREMREISERMQSVHDLVSRGIEWQMKQVEEIDAPKGRV